MTEGISPGEHVFLQGLIVGRRIQLGEHYAGGARRRLKLPGKGHQEEVEAFLHAIRGGLPSPIALDSLAHTSVATFAILDSLRTGLPQAVSLCCLNPGSHELSVSSSA